MYDLKVLTVKGAGLRIHGPKELMASYAQKEGQCSGYLAIC